MRMMRTAPYLVLAAAALAGACGEDDLPPAAVPGVTVSMDFSRQAGLFAAPFPSDDLQGADGRVDLSLFANPKKVALVQQGLTLLKQTRGFALSAGVFLAMTGAVDTKGLPGVTASTRPGAAVFLTPVAGPGAGDVRHPVEARFEVDGGPHGAANLLSLLPYQGTPLRPKTTYAAVVLRSLGDGSGDQLGVSLPMAQLAAGQRPQSLGQAAYQRYRQALETLAQRGVTRSSVAGLAVFTTGDPTDEMARVVKHALAGQLPKPATFTRKETFPGYCVYASTLQLPVYQGGSPPYKQTGGGWVFDAKGQPVRQRLARANIVVTVPRARMPAAGFPVVAFIRTGGGGERPLVDRGRVATDKGKPVTPGEGPAAYFASAGWAGVSVDGPHGGLRNVTNSDEQFLMFNFNNAAALRDNVRQSALEYTVLAHVLGALKMDVGGCPGVDLAGAKTARFDAAGLAIMGHSMGATIAPLTMAHEPRYRAAILSGAGASWIENVMYKRKPLTVRPVARLLVGYLNRPLVAHDPVLSLVQWAIESADPQVYARRIIDAPAVGEKPRHVLMLQDIVDNYILPRIANALSLSLGLDLAGAPLDSTKTKGLEDQTPLAQVLPLSGRKAISLPAAANRKSAGASATAVVVQHAEDGVQDGHEVVFQKDLPKHQYRCFLKSLAGGAPAVPASTSGACK